MKKVYIKAVSVKAAAYKNGGISYNGYAVFFNNDDGSAESVSRILGECAKDAAADYMAAKATARATDGGISSTEAAKKAKVAKSVALSLGRIHRRRTAAIVAAAHFADIFSADGAFLAETLKAEYTKAAEIEAEWEKAAEKARADRTAKWAAANPEKAAAKAKAAAEKAEKARAAAAEKLAKAETAYKAARAAAEKLAA